MPRGRPAAALTALEPQTDPVMTLTPERRALADAIAMVASLEADIATTSAAVSETETRRSEAFQKLEKAKRALERAKPRPETSVTTTQQQPGAFWGTQEAYDAHLAEEAIPLMSIADARAAVSTATDDYDSAKRAEQFHKNQLSRLQESLSWKRSSVGNAIRVVLRSDPALLALAVEARRLGTRARAAVYAFEHAIDGDVVQHGSPYYGYNRPAESFREDPEGWAVAHAWAVALESLKNDPSTPLPVPVAAP